MPIIVFDLDDTLYPEKDFVLSGFQAVDEWLLNERQLTGFNQIARQLFNAERRGDIFDQALLQMGRDPDYGLVRKMIDVYRSHTPSISLPEETRLVLSELKGDTSLAIITDGYLEVQRRKVAALNLSQYVDCIVYSDEEGHTAWKPSIRPYQRVTEYFQMNNVQFVYVGDNPTKDFISPNKLGWITIRVRREWGEHFTKDLAGEYRATHTVEKLSDMVPLIK